MCMGGGVRMCAHMRVHMFPFVWVCLFVQVCIPTWGHKADVKNLPHYSSTLFTEAGVSQPHSEVAYAASHTTQLVFQTCSVV